MLCYEKKQCKTAINLKIKWLSKSIVSIASLLSSFATGLPNQKHAKTNSLQGFDTDYVTTRSSPLYYHM